MGLDSTVGIQNSKNVNPIKFQLFQNYPNPFNISTKIKFSLSRKEKVKLEIFNILGQEVTTLVDKEIKAGLYEYIWNAKGKSSGLYFYRLQMGREVFVKKMI